LQFFIGANIVISSDLNELITMLSEHNLFELQVLDKDKAIKHAYWLLFNCFTKHDTYFEIL